MDTIEGVLNSLSKGGMSNVGDKGASIRFVAKEVTFLNCEQVNDVSESSPSRASPIKPSDPHAGPASTWFLGNAFEDGWIDRRTANATVCSWVFDPEITAMRW